MKTILSNVNMTRFNKKMKTLFTSFVVSSLLVLISTSASSQILNSTYSVTPPASTRSDPPSLMLSLSRDHQYFFKAYNDYTDLNPEDGLNVVETSYSHDIDYFGYFDSRKCYDYSDADGRFNPSSFVDGAADLDSLFADDGSRIGPHVCSGNWNGNFLNWMSMTRMDVVRRIFYGGLRSSDPTDPDQATVLERAYLPSDAHSFAKYYNGRGGATIAQLTEFPNPTNNGDDIDNIDEGYTFCNTSYVASTAAVRASQEVTAPPQIRAVQGNWQLWGSNERWQCTWADEQGDSENSNLPASGIFAHDSDPDEQDDNGQEFIARVSVCVDGLIGEEEEFCKTYPDGNVKPIGILQIYGDDGLINFGLMTGSYDNNTEGGVLRKNVGPLEDEVDVDATGVFTFTDTSDSIIKFLSLIRPWGYRLDLGTYISNNTSTLFDNCNFQLTDIPTQENGTRCNSWGNPISEIFAETIRYLAGLTENTTFGADDTDFITGLNDTPWVDPLNADENLCSDLNTVVINASVSSFDDDNAALSDVDGGINGNTIPATGNITDIWTDIVGANEVINQDAIDAADAAGEPAVNPEFINGSDFFIGVASGTDNDEFCTSKRVDALSEALGLCPEAPTVNGSFAMAGIAHYAHNNDIRPDLPGNQTVNTFAISLATNVPVISVPRVDSADSPVEILPAYRLLQGNDGGEGGGALVDFRIVEPHSSTDGNIFTARYYVNWEDSEQGGDYDQDVWGIISYSLNEAANQITITTEVFAESTVRPQLFGFVTNGTTDDGFHAFSGIEGANFVDPTGVPGCNNCRSNSEGGGGQRGQQSHTFTIAESTTNSLESPLYYAAKYGGFTENLAPGEQLTVNDLPDEESEFDSDGDGLPDNFFFVINPVALFDSLEEALQEILAQDAASSSAVANFAGQNGFGNIIIQGIYQESTTDSENSEVTWTGELFSFFIDPFGIFREDSNGDGILQGYETDLAFEYDSSSESALIQRLDVAFDLVVDTGDPSITQEVPLFLDDGSLDATATGGLIEPSELDTLWDAAERLRLINNEEIITNRPYNNALGDVTGNPTATGTGARYIFTHIDSNRNGEVDDDEQHIFNNQLFSAAEAGADAVAFFGVVNQNSANNIINFTRGLEASNENVSNYNPALNFRNRTILQPDGNGGEELQTFRLGDLVNSTPVTVAGPSENYGTSLNDESYAGFSAAFANRRQVTYVGSNDGLLHAFNNGFRVPAENITAFTTDSQFDPNATPQPLGTELWAYAPFNLLPHLQFLTLPNYLHNFYIDGSAEAFDVKIFDNAEGNCPILNDASIDPATDDLSNCRYVNGWGTILIAGMRQGGGDFPIADAAGNPLQDSDGDDFVTRSSYVILDVTNPELEPRVLAEVNHPDLNFTTSSFDVFYTCEQATGFNVCTGDSDPNNNFDGTWSLVFGSGPNDVRTFETDETAKVFSYNLDGSSDVEVTQVSDPATGDIAINSFVGGVSARDWDDGALGFRNDDVAYFGTVQNTDTVDAATNTTIPNDSGSVFRYFPDSIPVPANVGSRVNLLIDTERPVFEAPVTLIRDTLTNNVAASWIYVGTGIFLARENADITETERFIGVIEPINELALDGLAGFVTSLANINEDREDSALLTYASVTFDNLQDVTEVQVLNAGFLNGNENTPVVNSDGDIAVTGDFVDDLAVTNPPTAVGETTVDSVAELTQHILAATNGWYRDLPSNVTVDPSSRLTGAPVTVLNILAFTTFAPESQTGINICEGETGTSQLFVLDQTTGVASTVGALGVDSTTGIFSTATAPFVGNASSPVVFGSEALGTNDGRIIFQRNSIVESTRSSINNVEDIRSGWREIN